MARLDTFTFRVNEDERQMIERLSERLQRSQSDSVRWLIREAIQQINPTGKEGEARQDVSSN